MQTMKTSNCVICGDKAIGWGGHVVAANPTLFGVNTMKIIAGKCDRHKDVSVVGKPYNPEVMGKCVPFKF